VEKCVVCVKKASVRFECCSKNLLDWVIVRQHLKKKKFKKIKLSWLKEARSCGE